MSGVADIAVVLLVLGGAYVLIKSGKLSEILGGDFKLPELPALPGLPAPGAAPPTTGGTKTTPLPPIGGAGEIYQSTPGGKSCNNVSDGGLEQDGDRKEPQIACGFNFLNVEATAFINYRGINDTLSIKLRGPRHGGSTSEADMCNNIHYFGLGGSKSAFGKQAGHTAEYCEGGPSIGIPAGQWVGVKAIEWNEGSGVRMQSWIQNPEGSQWKLAADVLDNGNLGNCSGPAKAAYTKSPCSTGQVSTGFRVDGLKAGGDVQFKNLSVREIVPGKGGTSAPAPAAPAKQTIEKSNRAYAFAVAPTVAPRSITTVPLRENKSYSEVPIKVNGKPIFALYDTGKMGDLSIQKQIADSIGLTQHQPIKTELFYGVLGKAEKRPVYRVTVQIGDSKPITTEADIHPEVTLLGPNLVVKSGYTPILTGGAPKLVPTGTSIVAPVTVNLSRSPGKTGPIHIPILTVLINGKPVIMHYDTGASESFLLRRDAVRLGLDISKKVTFGGLGPSLKTTGSELTVMMQIGDTKPFQTQLNIYEQGFNTISTADVVKAGYTPVWNSNKPQLVPRGTRVVAAVDVAPRRTSSFRAIN